LIGKEREIRKEDKEKLYLYEYNASAPKAGECRPIPFMSDGGAGGEIPIRRRIINSNPLVRTGVRPGGIGCTI